MENEKQGITEEHQKESLSIAYVSAIVGKAGYSLSKHSFDYGVDCTVNEVYCFSGKYNQGGHSIDLQLKASKRYKEDTKNNSIIYQLEAKTYNTITNRNRDKTLYSSASPCILVLLCLPEDKNQWLEVTDSNLLLRYCCYWTDLNGNCQNTNNVSTCNIHISKKQILTPEALSELMERSKQRILKTD